jgi:hypothetical protein
MIVFRAWRLPVVEQSRPDITVGERWAVAFSPVVRRGTVLPDEPGENAHGGLRAQFGYRVADRGHETGAWVGPVAAAAAGNGKLLRRVALREARVLVAGTAAGDAPPFGCAAGRAVPLPLHPFRVPFGLTHWPALLISAIRMRTAV